MDYRAVQINCSWRLAVNLHELQTPFSHSRIVRLLNEWGFVFTEIDLLFAARNCLRRSVYNRQADPSQAPDQVNCATFTKYLYSLIGVWLPRYSIQQSELGEVVADWHNLRLGDLLFSPGSFPLSRIPDQAGGVGHVGLATGQGTIIHASKAMRTVREVPVEKYFKMRDGVQLIKRLIRDPDQTRTFFIPSGLTVESTDDLRWLIHTHLVR